ncbi:MAG: hypothetical protein HYR56_02220 [Acidobacteria bacterium]|nr:hypothetical protein [Acidobacteriota bacterium]MBI3421326.1 hypothetical protein [Acidobacteriota bacterium]
MNKPGILVLLAIALLMGMIVGCGVFYGNILLTPYKLTTLSPTGVYRIAIREKVFNDSSYKVLLSQLSDERQSIGTTEYVLGEWGRPASLLSGYEAQPRFFERFTQHIWVANNIVRFSSQPINSGREADLIYVHNDTDTAINYLRVDCSLFRPDEMFLAFDLPPHATITIHSLPQTSNVSHLYSQGAFVNGKEISETYLSFDAIKPQQSPSHYCLTINERKVVISSEEFEGFYRRDADPVTGSPPSNPQLRIPRAATCKQPVRE